MVLEERMLERIFEINAILQEEKEKCSGNEIEKLEFEKSILEEYLVEE